jgi:hypothetical protein
LEEPGRDQLSQRFFGNLLVVLMEARARSVFGANVQGQVKVGGFHKFGLVVGFSFVVVFS